MIISSIDSLIRSSIYESFLKNIHIQRKFTLLHCPLPREFKKRQRWRDLGRHGPIQWISSTTFSFAAIKNKFLPGNLQEVGHLALLFNSEFSKEKSNVAATAFSAKLGECSLRAVVLQRTAEKPTRLYFTRAVSLFCSLTLCLVASYTSLTSWFS